MRISPFGILWMHYYNIVKKFAKQFDCLHSRKPTSGHAHMFYDEFSHPSIYAESTEKMKKKNESSSCWVLLFRMHLSNLILLHTIFRAEVHCTMKSLILPIRFESFSKCNATFGLLYIYQQYYNERSLICMWVCASKFALVSTDGFTYDLPFFLCNALFWFEELNAAASASVAVRLANAQSTRTQLKSIEYSDDFVTVTMISPNRA